MDRTKYKNNYSKERYDIINFIVPKVEKETIKKVSQSLGMSMNEYLYLLVKEDIKKDKSRLAADEFHFTEEQIKILEKWQIPKKYHEMIQSFSYSKEEGYYIKLHDAYINDISNSCSVFAKNYTELRMSINKSHKK